MQPQFFTLIASLLISAGCIGLGYSLAGYGWVSGIYPLMALVWVLGGKRSVFWAASILLFLQVGLAALGMYAGFSLALMVLAVTSALICWDLVLFKEALRGNPVRINTSALEKPHLSALAVTAAAGLVLAGLGAHLNLNIPLGATALLVLFALGGLGWAVKKGS